MAGVSGGALAAAGGEQCREYRHSHVIVGEGVDMVRAAEPAEATARRIAAGAERVLARGADLMRAGR